MYDETYNSSVNVMRGMVLTREDYDERGQWRLNLGRVGQSGLQELHAATRRVEFMV